jgi:hypothetical protein
MIPVPVIFMMFSALPSGNDPSSARRSFLKLDAGIVCARAPKIKCGLDGTTSRGRPGVIVPTIGLTCNVDGNYTVAGSDDGKCSDGMQLPCGEHPRGGQFNSGAQIGQPFGASKRVIPTPVSTHPVAMEDK